MDKYVKKLRSSTVAGTDIKLITSDLLLGNNESTICVKITVWCFQKDYVKHSPNSNNIN